jgi:hypothetical protein
LVLAYLEDKEHFESLKEGHRDDANEIANIETDEREEFEVTKKIIKELMYNGADRTLTVRLTLLKPNYLYRIAKATLHSPFSKQIR